MKQKADNLSLFQCEWCEGYGCLAIVDQLPSYGVADEDLEIIAPCNFTKTIPDAERDRNWIFGSVRCYHCDREGVVDWIERALGIGVFPEFD